MLRLTGTGLFLDAHRRQPLSFVSHAHADHIARHAHVVATRETVAFVEHRLGKLESASVLAYREGLELEGLRLELFSAGHVLGSAQLRVTRPDGHRVVYSGDLSLAPALTAAPAEVAPCDTLVLESTFGHPRYRFPPRDAVFDEVAAWARQELSRGRRPVLYAYALGKAQEAIAQLSRRGLALCAHEAIHDVAALYGRLGAPVHARRFDGGFRDGEVGVFPPFGRARALKDVPRRSTAVLTGWAVDAHAARRYGADVAFPVSDHADFPALLEYAAATGAREVVTVHGFAEELARALRAKGLFARPAERALQLELPLAPGVA